MYVSDGVCCSSRKEYNDYRLTVLKHIQNEYSYDGINFLIAYGDIAFFENHFFVKQVLWWFLKLKMILFLPLHLNILIMIVHIY